MEEKEKYDTIEKYLAGELDAKEQQNFERQLESDPDLQKELDLHDDLSNRLKGEKIHDFRKVLQAVDQDWQAPHQDPQKRPILFRLPYIAAIAASLLLAVLAYQFLQTPSMPSNSELFATYFEPYNMVLNERSENDNPNAVLLNAAVVAYSTKDFVQAAKQFSSLIEKVPENKAYAFYAAQAELAVNNSAKAIPLFRQLSSEGDHPFVELSRWYLALAFLQEGNVVEAKKQLETIKSGQDKFAEAQTLLKLF